MNTKVALKIMKYDPLVIENEVLVKWAREKTYEKARKQGGKPFYFLDGPPYTSGKIHLGTAWNKSLKDMVLRYRRMIGDDVWDRAGYDMHGLPTENATMKKLGLKTNEDIFAFGLDKFIDECRKLCLENLSCMNDDFQRLGVWMDFDDAYQSITKDFMSGEWWLIKRAHEEGRLYEGLRTMTWCRNTESALAKHEIEYKTVTDESIFVKFPLLEKENEFFIIWTTTPWTIPFNLAIMAGPDIEYVKVKVTYEGEEQFWYLAKELVGDFLAVVDIKYELVDEMKGKDLAGIKYKHPFYDELEEQYQTIEQESKNAFSILLSKDHVDTSAGSGLVHCAPGCGPEDYEVGYKNGVPAFNTISTKGIFPESMGPFANLTARIDDKKFIKILKENGCLVATSVLEHEYPHDWRYHEPVVFRTTKQWFFKIEDLKEELIKENDSISWIPQAAYRAFDSWLKNLRDNSISKQRFWGCPVPIWRNKEDPEDYLVIGSAQELEELSEKKIDDLHISTVDKILIKKDNKVYERVPDVLDVWVDAGTTSWNCLYNDKKLIDKFFPATFILEGKDQIRGWFNLLHIASMIGYGKPSFENCYMHGFVNDAKGRKMSKSLGNTISPNEVVEKYGADTMRYYMIGAANPGLDMNYNFDDIELKHRNLHVFWNVHMFILDMKENGAQAKDGIKSIEEKYILSVLHRTTRDVTNAFEEYRLNEIPRLIEECLMELSRTYIQLVRDKARDEEHRDVVLYTASTTFKNCLVMFATVAPFISEKMYENLKVFGFTKESIHHEEWPEFNESFIDEDLEKEFKITQSIISGVLAAREQANIGVRWPLQKAIIETQKSEISSSVKNLRSIIMQQTNVKDISFENVPVRLLIKPNYKALGKEFGKDTATVAKAIIDDAETIAEVLATGVEELTVEGFTINKAHLQVSHEADDGFAVAQVSGALIAVPTALSAELEAEGFVRELSRRVQNMRKDAGLQKKDRIDLFIGCPDNLLERISSFSEFLEEKCGASVTFKKHDDAEEVVIRGEKFFLSLIRK